MRGVLEELRRCAGPVVCMAASSALVACGGSDEPNDAGFDSRDGSDSLDGSVQDASLDAGLAGDAAGADGTDRCAASMIALGESTKVIDVGGVERTFLVHVPSSYDGRSRVPVVIDFHPLAGSPTRQMGVSGWAALGNREGFITVFPSGIGRSWNAGRCCGPAQSDGVDDVAFTHAIIASLQAEACIDPKRVYASGCSNGGGMAYKVACEAADVVAGVAPVDFDCSTGPTNDPACGGCAPVRPVSEIQFRATGDQLVPYDGGPTSVVPGLEFPGAEANFATWGEINACSGSPQALSDHPTCQTFPTCGGDVDTVLCTVEGGTHCGNYASFGIVEIAWKILRQASLP